MLVAFTQTVKYLWGEKNENALSAVWLLADSPCLQKPLSLQRFHRPYLQGFTAGCFCGFSYCHESITFTEFLFGGECFADVQLKWLGDWNDSQPQMGIWSYPPKLQINVCLCAFIGQLNIFKVPLMHNGRNFCLIFTQNTHKKEKSSCRQVWAYNQTVILPQSLLCN